jgi:hypothetical protein
MMVKGDTSRKGAIPQELAIDSSKFIEELAERDIKIEEYVEHS